MDYSWWESERVKTWKSVFSVVKKDGWFGKKLEEQREEDVTFQSSRVDHQESYWTKRACEQVSVKSVYFCNYKNTPNIFLSVAGWQDFLCKVSVSKRQ